LAGIYRPRRPESSPLYQLLEGHYPAAAGFRAVYEERFESQYGFWRPVIEQVVYKFLDCGVLEQGFARVQCSGCKAEFLVAFSPAAAGCRYFCPSCHAKRLALWSIWLEEDLLEAVPHRSRGRGIFTLPKRLRAYCLRSRSLLGELAREAAHTTIRFVRATLDEPELSVGVVLSIQTHGSLVFTSTCW